MPRKSLRNLLAPLRSVSVDITGDGPDVSDDIQLTYQLGDLSHATYAWAGAGIRENAAVGELGVLTLEVRNPHGLVIDRAVSFRDIGNFARNEIFVSATIPTIIGANPVPLDLLSGPAPHTIGTAGTILAASIPASSLSFLNSSETFAQGLWVQEGRFFTLVHLETNQTVNLSIRFHELGRDFLPSDPV